MIDFSVLYKNILSFYGKLSSVIFSDKALPPIHAILELTYLCNLKCKMCYQESIRAIRGKKFRQELTTDEIKMIADWMKPGTLITLTGGEVFAKKDSLEIIKYICKNHRCNIITNAALINQQIAESIIDSGVILLGISIDGIGKTHDDIRRVEGTFEKAKRAIRLVQKLKNKAGKKFPLIDIKMVVLEENVEQVFKIYKLAKGLNADYFTISVAKPDTTIVIPPVKKTISRSEYLTFPKVTSTVDFSQLTKQVEKIRNSSGKSPVLRFYPDGVDGVFGGYYDNKLSIQNYHPCTYPWTTITVSPYGDVFPCFQLFMGNIRKTSLDKIWNGARFRDFRRKLKTKGIFPACHGCCNSRLKK